MPAQLTLRISFKSFTFLVNTESNKTIYDLFIDLYESFELECSVMKYKGIRGDIILDPLRTLGSYFMLIDYNKLAIE